MKGKWYQRGSLFRAASVFAGLVLALGAALVATAAPQDDIPQEVVLANGFRIIFDGVEHFGDGTSTWYYTVEELPEAKDLSNWVLETPFCAPIIDAGPEPWEIVDPDPNAHLSGVKWETGDGFEQGQFWVSLITAGQPGLTNVAAKGPKMAFGQLAGPTCTAEEPPEDPPGGNGDDVPPTIEWLAPVTSGEVYEMQEGDTVELVLNAGDDVGVDRVEILRWDYIAEDYVTIAVDTEAPYGATVSANELHPTWNQIYAASYDAAGNYSGWDYIWLYKITDGALFGGFYDNSLFLPMMQR